MAELDTIYSLIAELRQVVTAIENFDGGGHIWSMTVGPPGAPEDSPPGSSAAISTVEMTYPPQMAEALKTMLETRRSEINDQLAQLGVVVAEQPRRAAEDHPRPRRK